MVLFHRNFGLLSFGEEAEVDEMETSIFTQKNAGKAKSMHDAIDDPKLSKKTGQDDETTSICSTTNGNESNNVVNEIKKRLQCHKKDPETVTKKKLHETNEIMEENDDNNINDSTDDEDCLTMLDEEKKIEHAKKR